MPYAQALARLPAWLQQLTLESNGKRVTREGSPVEGPTAPALWGDTLYVPLSSFEEGVAGLAAYECCKQREER